MLPYDLAVRGGSVYVADGERHQILRYVLSTGRMTVFAGTGGVGTAGDGGPARRARLTEPTELVFDRDPYTSWLLRLGVSVLSLLPLDDLL